VLRFVASALEKAGYRVHTANNAAEAVAAHAADRGERFGLLLSDVIMPHESGVELARRLTANDGDLRVLFMSGNAAGIEVPKELAGRACELLHKPFRSEGLLRAVRATLERGRPRAASVGSPSR
jgi:two-component system, cell cycle sensor histidine kinase and response regulator CckA